MADISSNFFSISEKMKCTLAITQQCNLACDYCYIQKKNAVMSLSTAEKAIDFIFKHAKESNRISINFFGGEPLLEFDLIKKITNMIHSHQLFNEDLVTICVGTNGTILSEDIVDFLIRKNIQLFFSCDGPQNVHDTFRRFSDGRGSSAIVEKNIKQALKIFPITPVNAVYSPENVRFLPQVVDYLISLGVRNIYLSPNISAKWTKNDAEKLPIIYDTIGKKYLDFCRKGVPRYINFIDDKIAVILRGGYKPLERCRMGKAEFAFAPSGNVYLCERLIGSDEGKEHCLGNINTGLINENSCEAISKDLNEECLACGLRDFCINWCGCTNYHSTGNYNVVSPFMCASERAALTVAFSILQNMENLGLDLSHHRLGLPLINVLTWSIKEQQSQFNKNGLP
jgi:radical SAM additional 4Fe4S-binding domain